jgi:hypothetical protein
MSNEQVQPSGVIEPITEDEQVQPLRAVEPIPKADLPYYERLSAVATQTQRLLNSSASTRSDQGAEWIHDEWQSVQPIIAKAIKLMKEGSKNWYVTGVPNEVAKIVERVAILVDQGMTEVRPDLDQAIGILDLYQDQMSTELAGSLPQLATANYYSGLDALYALSVMAKYSKDTQVRANALNAMGQAVPKIAEGATSAQCTNQYEYIPYLLQLLDHQDEAVQKQAKAAMRQVLQTRGEQTVRLLSRDSDQTRAVALAQENAFMAYIKEELETYGLQADSVMRPWVIDTNKPKFHRDYFYGTRAKSIPTTLQKLGIIEKERPGIAADLQKRFGINNFSWYPEQMLIRQYDEMDDSKKPYGVVWAPSLDIMDWVPGNMPAIEELYTTIGNEYGIRFFEADGKSGQNGVGRRFFDFHQNYYVKGGHKIEFMVILGHSSVSFDRMHFGSGYDRGDNIYLEDLQSSKVLPLKDAFVTKPDIIWASCGSERKLAPALGTALDARVIGSQYGVNKIEHFEIRKESGRLHLDPVFVEIELE